MLDVAIMIEGQDGVNWQRWQRIVRAVEDLGFAGLFRSDHFLNPTPPNLDSLELWASLTWLASNTTRIQFGPLVTPVSFRDPRITAWTAAAVDDLSGGRLVLGLGAGWQEREHRSFGFQLPPLGPRFARLEEALQVVQLLLRGDGPVSFEGRYYRLDQAELRPRPRQRGGPPILIGGNGRQRTLPLAARYADEWNAVSAPLERISELNAELDRLLEANGRRPADVRRSYMATVVHGRDHAELERRLRGRDAQELRARGAIVGTTDAILQHVEQLAAAGIQRVMLRWLDLDDLDGLEALARAILPHLPGTSG